MECRKFISILALLSGTFLSSSVFGQIQVAVEDGSTGNAGSGAGIVTQLNDDTWANFNATLVTADDIDTPGELAAYDVVIIGGSGYNNADWTEAMADALKDWVEAGGGVILTGWGNYEMQNGSPEEATIASIIPTDNEASTNEFISNGETYTIVTNHPIVNGITDFALPNGCCTEVVFAGVDPGEVEIATAGGGTATAIGFPGSGRSVYLGPVYMASESNYSSQFPFLRQGDLDRLLEQAVMWAANAGAVRPTAVEQEPFIPTPVPSMTAIGSAVLVALLMMVGIRRIGH